MGALVRLQVVLAAAVEAGHRLLVVRQAAQPQAMAVTERHLRLAVRQYLMLEAVAVAQAQTPQTRGLVEPAVAVREDSKALRRLAARQTQEVVVEVVLVLAQETQQMPLVAALA